VRVKGVFRRKGERARDAQAVAALARLAAKAEPPGERRAMAVRPRSQACALRAYRL
jgi:hypothetical protein